MRPTRSVQLRQQGRRVLVWSLAVAAVIHVAVFALWPRTPVRPLGELRATPIHDVEEGDVFVEISAEFGGPLIVSAGEQPASDRVEGYLQANRLTRVSLECREAFPPGVVHEGEVRLVVNEQGRVESKEVTRESGAPCGDRALLAVAGDLWYRWLPSRSHPAPVVLVQPVSVEGATE